jgi:LemA protein
MSILAGLFAAVVLLVVYMIMTYNSLVVTRQNVRESWSAVETELRRRFDLIPNIVEAVKGYAGHEKDTLEAVIKARNSAATNNGTPAAIAGSQDQLSGALSKLFALSESYPQLKANENFMQLQSELGETETRLSQARRFYNANVRELNAKIESFPTVLIAGQMGFSVQPYFGIENPDAFEPVKVNFGNPGMQTSQAQKINLSTPLSVEEKEKLN